MKIIIDISEDIREHIIDGSFGLRPDDRYALVTAVMDGTILPEGHGDLIDRNNLLDCSYKVDSMYCEYDEVVKVDDIKDASAIIKADRE